MLFKKIFIFLCTFLFSFTLFSQGTWVQKGILPFVPRFTAVAFTIGNDGYMGTGVYNSTSLTDLWKYDVATDTWLAVGFSGIPSRSFAVGFSIGNYGYIGTGTNGSSALNDWWRYDPISTSWTQVASMINPRMTAFSFSVNGKGYVGAGDDIYTNQVFQDMWEYNPLTNIWVQKNPFPGGKRADIDRAVFVIGNKAYIGTGWDRISNAPSSSYNDFWEYDPTADSWTQKVNFPGTARYGATGFSICNRGYLGLGTQGTNDLWMYDPISNTWIQDVNLPGSGRSDAPSFVINNKAYIGTGLGTNQLNDFWEYTPNNIFTGNVVAGINCNNTTICFGQSTTLAAYGASNYLWNNGATANTITVSPTCTTTYSVIGNDICGSDSASITIVVPPLPTATINGNTSLCSGNSLTLSVSGGVNYLWSNGLSASSIIVNPTTTTNYSVTVYDLFGCNNSTSTQITVANSPTINISANTTIVEGDSTSLYASSSGNYLWNTGATSSEIIVSPSSTTSYCVSVNDSNNCISTVCVSIFVLDICTTAGELFLPNAFSPNADADNDTYRAFYKIPECIKSFYLIIYNRWGEKVFETTDQLAGWDGTYHEKKENPGVYTYYLEATLSSDKVIHKKGNVSLVR